MSELLQNAEKRKELLKHMILQLHKGEAPPEVRQQLVRLLGKVPYSEVVEVEQQLIAEGLPEQEILRFCDVHSEALKGVIEGDVAKEELPAGHPLHTLKRENQALLWESKAARGLVERAAGAPEAGDARELLVDLRMRFFRLADIDKHYKRKENLLFSHLERHGITGPSTVMWGKDDEVRQKLKDAVQALEAADGISCSEAAALGQFLLIPALDAVEEMVFKEEEILFPMCREKLSDGEWLEIYQQSPEIGYCLVEPEGEWRPAVQEESLVSIAPKGGKIKLASGSFNEDELTAILNTIPFDITFVDKNDEVRYFSEGRERIFDRNRSILGRNVRRCHPPKSLHVVERIIDDFKNKREDHAAFWITMNGRFIHIEYFALRDAAGEYLGVLEVSQDLTEKRALQGERRLLSYEEVS